MSSWRLILRSLLYHRRVNFSVALGVAAATAVLTGALLVGDSMRGSLRDLVLERLGLIDQVLIGERFFREELAAEIAGAKEFDQNYAAVLPVVLLQTTIENAESERRAAQVATIGGDEDLWSLDPARQYPELKYGELVINQPLADELGITEAGQEVLLRLARPSNIPADSPLGEKIEETQSRRLTVAAIIPPSGLGRFSLSSNQQLPLVAFTLKSTLQGRSLLNRRDEVNGLIVAGQRRDAASTEPAQEKLQASLRPSLSDLGLTLEEIRLGDHENPVAHYYQLSSDQMVIPPAVVDAITREFAEEDVQVAITYLANWVAAKADVEGATQARIPYSTITALDTQRGLGPLLDASGKPIPLADDQIVLNSWAADDLERQGANLVPGDEITLTFFEPESTHGQVQEQTATFHLATVVRLAEKGAPPTLVTDPNFTPTVPGLTDQESIDNWDPPFPYDRSRVRIHDRDDNDPYDDIDEQYWKAHKATPKGFVTLVTGRRLWSSRFGAVTTIRIPAKEVGNVASVDQRALQAIDPADVGFVFRPVKQEALSAAQGTTSFSGLFIGFSFFIIAAAVMLVALLFQLGVDQRASQLGLQLAVGLRRRKVATQLIVEAAVVAALGGVLGTALGVGYAWLMLTGLSTWWVDAVAARFLTLHVPWPTLMIGFFSGVLISVLAIAVAVWRTRRVDIRSLMTGRTNTHAAGLPTRATTWAVWIAGLCLLVAVGLLAFATQLAGEAQAGAFFGGGALVLTALLLWIWSRLQTGHRGAAIAQGRRPLWRLAVRNVGRNPGRSTLTIGLVASATFLIVAISAFRIDPDPKGAGNFDILAETTQPILYDLNTKEGRDEFRIDQDAEAKLAKVDFLALRQKAGDDASCLNLYQPRQPQILGVSDSMVNYLDTTSDVDFSWAESDASTPEERANPWRLLDRTFEDTPDAIPVILDKNTAMYSLHLFVTKGTGVVWEVPVPGGPALKLRIVGLLANSIFQGSLLIGEAQFTRNFPDVSGYQVFLAKSRGPSNETLIDTLESSFGEWGLDATDCQARLASLLAVQNTYLTTFQTLGALGLLLGTFGLATVQLRSVLERRGELALMRSTGFRRTRLARLVMLEHLVLLLGGLTTGLLAALLAVWPHWLTGGAAVPVEDLAVYLGVIVVVGLVSGLAAVIATLRAPLLAALRGN